MAQPESKKRVARTPAQRMRDRRKGLADQNLTQTKITISAPVKQRILDLKANYKMAGMDNVISAMIRNAMATYTVEELPLPPPTPEAIPTSVITVHLSPEHRQFLKDVGRFNRGTTMGIALEAVAMRVHNLRPGARQMPLFDNTMKEGSAVSG
ncbi:hypothetical protein [Erythrobacter sp. MTPC3]|uniref:hypothetical protein n=1 Tax=Erythrobacter sp. MTPC3 TaxID=3056564 RepID=UPI0036F20A5F